VAVLDYASLYPSVIIQHNLCFSTLLNRPAALTTAGLAEVPPSHISIIKTA
jgi:DNA polymerase elongation subunit (family B)